MMTTDPWPLTTDHSARPLRVGVFGIGLDTYWPQFAGLHDRLAAQLDRVARKLALPGVAVHNAGLVDNPDRARAAGHEFRAADVDILFLYVTTYALSSTVLPVAQIAKVPVVILNLAPAPAIDYAAFNRLPDRVTMTGEWLAHCSACPVPEIANVFKRARIPFHQVTGTVDDDPAAWREITEWVEAARVAAAMRDNRLGLMGSYYGGMLDIYTDLTLQQAVFGTHLEFVEVGQLARLRARFSDADVARRAAEFSEKFFDVQPDCAPADIAAAARTSLALDALADANRLGSLAYYHRNTGVAENDEAINTIIPGASILTQRHIPVAGEYEVKNAQAMKVMDLFGAGGSFTEYYALDFAAGHVLMGHDGPGHLAIAEGRTKLRPLRAYHGKTGSGLSVEMSVRHGPVTLLSVIEENGSLALLTALGESVPGPILEIGNTNSRYKFTLPPREFANAWNAHGPAHHCAIGTGDVTPRLAKLAALLGIPAHRVC
ncbi:MAG: hypothetical protein LBR07_03235 [Puniceicoccales bacterium]|jgi:L-arabinose isomerase|nr:hypothetical protein [Puniceicoccales bacterium]